MFNKRYGKVRKVRWWEKYTDKQVREASRNLNAQMTGERHSTPVTATANGYVVQVPDDQRQVWEELPEEIRQAFLDSVDAHISGIEASDKPTDAKFKIRRHDAPSYRQRTKDNLALARYILRGKFD